MTILILKHLDAACMFIWDRMGSDSQATQPPGFSDQPNMALLGIDNALSKLDHACFVFFLGTCLKAKRGCSVFR